MRNQMRRRAPSRQQRVQGLDRQPRSAGRYLGATRFGPVPPGNGSPLFSLTSHAMIFPSSGSASATGNRAVTGKHPDLDASAHAFRRRISVPMIGLAPAISACAPAARARSSSRNRRNNSGSCEDMFAYMLPKLAALSSRCFEDISVPGLPNDRTAISKFCVFTLAAERFQIVSDALEFLVPVGNLQLVEKHMHMAIPGQSRILGPDIDLDGQPFRRILAALRRAPGYSG